MKTRTYISNKLWRDKGLSTWTEQGSSIQSRILDDAEFDRELRKKLVEEAEEVVTAATKQDIIEELADIAEVRDTLCALHDITLEEITVAQERKREKRGGFQKRLFVETSTHPIGSEADNYCVAQPHKYPRAE